MAEILKVQLEDSEGNVYYLTTNANNVFCSDGTSVQTKLNAKIDIANIINNVTTNDSNKVVSAAVAKNLQDQITNQNKLLNTIIQTERSSENSAWIVKAYTDYTVCQYTISTSGVYIAFAKVLVRDYKNYCNFYASLYQNNNGNGSACTLPSISGYDVIFPLSCIFHCKVGDKICTSINTNYIKDGDGTVGYAYGNLNLLKLS